jgi:hypothetical protein
MPPCRLRAAPLWTSSALPVAPIVRFCVLMDVWMPVDERLIRALQRAREAARQGVESS